MEGRTLPLYFFGRRHDKAAIYSLPGGAAGETSLGLGVFPGGVCLVLLRRKTLTGQTVAIYASMGSGSFPAGARFSKLCRRSAWRHALPLFSPLALLGALTFKAVSVGQSRACAIGFDSELLRLALSFRLVPVMRPWEYYNELAGGAREGISRYFNDEGLDRPATVGTRAYTRRT